MKRPGALTRDYHASSRLAAQRSSVLSPITESFRLQGSSHCHINKDFQLSDRSHDEAVAETAVAAMLPSPPLLPGPSLVEQILSRHAWQQQLLAIRSERQRLHAQAHFARLLELRHLSAVPSARAGPASPAGTREAAKPAQAGVQRAAIAKPAPAPGGRPEGAPAPAPAEGHGEPARRLEVLPPLRLEPPPPAAGQRPEPAQKAETAAVSSDSDGKGRACASGVGRRKRQVSEASSGRGGRLRWGEGPDRGQGTEGR